MNDNAQPIFFVHVMKTGGVTLFEHLRGAYGEDEVYPSRRLDTIADRATPVVFRPFTVRYLESLPPERRRRIRVYVGHFPFVATAAMGGGFRTLTILRDPVERTISLLRHLRRPVTWAAPSHWTGQPFEAVYEGADVYEPLVHNHQTKIFSMTLADRPTGYMQTIAVDTARLALAKQNLASTEVVGLTERYGAFLDAVADHFGWDVDRQARLNAAPADDDVRVSEALRRRIADDNAIDMEFYEYARALVDARR